MFKKRIFNFEKGSISIYVIATVFCFLIILGGIYAGSSNIRKNELKTLLKIKEIYAGTNLSNTDETVEDLNMITTTNHKTIKVKDAYGNSVTVPEGFKVVEGSVGEEISVQNGVVIEDSAGNQFVWIPVGVVTKNDGTKSNEIKLGRYTFSSTDGTPTLQQSAFAGDKESNLTQTYADAFTISSYYQELATASDGVASLGLDGKNATAKNLEAFVQSVEDNGGYYIARYEASYGSGTSTSDYKPLSKPSTANSASSMNYAPGTLWNFITQLDAAKVARNMYLNNQDINGNTVGVESDLVNSYAWDTAIVYIQEMGKSNYANANRDTTGNTSLMNTGATGDVACNIYDMAANEYEWTTEYSSYTYGSRAYPCAIRGGYYNLSSDYTAGRYYGDALYGYNYISFRSTLYVQTV